jgi:predicted TIM-barrel fold metal-dependent hydrolase
VTINATTLEKTPAELGYRIIDADGHFGQTDRIWKDYLPAKYQEMAPRQVTDSMGRSRMVIGDFVQPVLGLPLPQRGYPPAEPGAHEAGTDPHARLAIMDDEGIFGNVIYPSAGFILALKDADLMAALCRAHNDWAADFCSVAPGRFFAPAVVPQLDIALTLAEVRRAVGEKGLSGILLRPNPIGRTIEDPAWEPLWSLLEELDVPVGIHEGTGTAVPHLGADRTENFLFQHCMSHPFEHMAAMLALIGGGVLERHPSLRVIFLEAGCGWVPYWLHRIEHHIDGPYRYLDLDLSLTATEYFRRQCFVASDAEEEDVLASVAAQIGADNICWSSDFPHPDHSFHGMARGLMDRTDLSDGDKRKILGDNVTRAYKIA